MIARWLALTYSRLPVLYRLPLAALVSLDTLRNALDTLGYPAVALFIMIESTGIPFPGETMLLLASFYAAVDHTLQIPLVIACAAIGAIMGDNCGFWIGRTGGYALVRRFGRYVFLKPKHLQKAEHFFARHGDKTVFFGRFVAVLRAWAAFLAGVNRMRWPAFLLYNAAGGILWSIIYGCLGFYCGRIFHDNFDAVERLAKTISWSSALLIIAAVIAIYIFFRLRHKRRAVKPENKVQDTPPTPVPEATASLRVTPEEQTLPETVHSQQTTAHQPEEPLTHTETDSPSPDPTDTPARAPSPTDVPHAQQRATEVSQETFSSPEIRQSP